MSDRDNEGRYAGVISHVEVPRENNGRPPSGNFVTVARMGESLKFYMPKSLVATPAIGQEVEVTYRLVPRDNNGWPKSKVVAVLVAEAAGKK